MPIIHTPRIESGRLNDTELKFNLLPRSDSGHSVSRYVVPIVVAIVVPLGIALFLVIYRSILYLSKHPAGTPGSNDRPPRKLRKRRTIERRNQISEFHRRQDNDEVEDAGENSINESGNIPDDINLSLLSSLHSPITHVESATSAVSETFPLMRGSTPISMDPSSLPDIERPTQTHLEELEERVQRLEGRLTSLDSAEQENQNRSARAEDPLLEEQLPAYTSRPASFVLPRGVSTSSDWTSIT